MWGFISGLGRFWISFFLGLLPLVGIGIGATGGDPGPAGPAGRAGVTRQRNSTANIVSENKTLLADNTNVLADQQTIQTQAANVVTEQDRLDLVGDEQACEHDVATYNADVQGVLAQGQLPDGLPQAYNANTICKAS